ncbi:Astacin (Peptidase M12A) [Parelaphostrongylus tenuis]|uniref:Astacin (Peptidase M12A) n=1 Tax=Parelaphostrongylus tenuis TaxID=148309 RepID=A0AAD5MKK9_PARTN|nr:Astacin (Peptidase M12A) [Parelaphostrongylus tenuis]
MDKILVVKGQGCWSHLGRINGTQALSLGDGCESPPGCGAVLKATESYQELSDTVGQSNYDRNADNDDFKMCNYWIEAPAGSKIEVIFQSYTGNLSCDGCIWAGVEIKTLADKRHNRFCSPNYGGTRLVSVHNIVPIITYSSVQKATSLLRYRIASSDLTVSEQTPPNSQPTVQPSSTETPPHEKECKDHFLCIILEDMGFCSSSEYKSEFKEELCPGLCV